MQETRYLGIDPGGTTGLAIYTETPETPQGEGIWKREQVGPVEHHAQLMDRLRALRPDLVVCERFTYQQRDKVILVPVEYIGIVKLYCIATRTKLHFQMASQAVGEKCFWNDKKLAQIGLHLPGQPHANDATRHLLYYFMTQLHDSSWVHKLERP